MENKSILHEMKVLDHLIIRNLFLEKSEYLKEAPTLTQVQIMGYLMKNENKEVYQNDLETFFNVLVQMQQNIKILDSSKCK